MKKYCLIFLMIVFLVSCSQTTARGTPSGFLATMENKLTPEPLIGRLFFDMNGSGLQDEATFVYDASRLTDELQPLHPDLLKTVQAYVVDYPELKTGDLVTLDEPGLSGFTVCAGEICGVTDDNGDFALPLNEEEAQISIIDPNVGNAALAMRYINQWKGPVIVPEYTKEIDAETMAGLTTVAECREDSETLVCKQDEKILLVREQHLNDTQVIPLSDGIDINNGHTNFVGLMQGWLNSSHNYPVYVYFDVDPSNSVSRNFKGGNSNPPSAPPNIGFDGHTGLDLPCNIGEPVTSFSPGRVIYEGDNGRGALIAEMQVIDEYTTHYGHLSAVLINPNDSIIYRNQVVGLCGETGTDWSHIHFQSGNKGQPIDPFQDLYNKTNSENLWIVYNTVITE